MKELTAEYINERLERYIESHQSDIDILIDTQLEKVIKRSIKEAFEGGDRWSGIKGIKPDVQEFAKVAATKAFDEAKQGVIIDVDALRADIQKKIDREVKNIPVTIKVGK